MTDPVTELPPSPEGAILNDIKVEDNSPPPLPGPWNEQQLPPLPQGATLNVGGEDPPSWYEKLYSESYGAQGMLGAAEVVATMGTGAVSSITSGFAATLSMLTGNQNFDQAKEWMDGFNDAFTYQPRSKTGQAILEGIAGPMLYIDDTADAIATYTGGGNPYSETIIKTALLGALELASPAKGVKNVNAAIRHMAASKKAIAQTADDLGINVNIRELKESVVDAANKMTPNEKGENSILVRDAMREAEAVAKAEKNALYEAARKKEVWVDTRSVNDVAIGTRAKLRDTYDISEMTKLNKRINEMATVFPPGTKIKFWELEKIRRKTNSNINGLRASDPEQAAALGVLKRDIDRFIENEFNKTALEVGQQGPPNQMLITGEHAGIQAWKDARAANARWKQDFHTDRAIKDLIDQDATPETITDWILGATAMGGKQQAVATVVRLKQVLGDGHPAIKGIQQDFLFRVAEPLLQEKPNFAQFIRNYDTMIRRNHSLVNELGLNESNFNELVTFAREARKLPVNERDFKLQDLTRGLAVFLQGHEMAKRSLRVGYARNILNGLFNMDRVAQKSLLYDMAGIRYGYPAFPKNGPLAGQFIAGASLNELMMEQDAIAFPDNQ